MFQRGVTCFILFTFYWCLAPLYVFNWTGNQNVADVRKEDYNNYTTNTRAPSKNRPIVFTGSPNMTVFAFTLVNPGPHNYICTIDDHCERGQKFSIDVKWPFSTYAPSPAPTTP
ncbi:hypothetical protein K1719_011392 [Acacia pycnantha]|nr:hypothetical protein K1719_011392 [Acacia pycnantha]